MSGINSLRYSLLATETKLKYSTMRHSVQLWRRHKRD